MTPKSRHFLLNADKILQVKPVLSVTTPNSSAGMVVLRFKLSLAQNSLGTLEKYHSSASLLHT